MLGLIASALLLTAPPALEEVRPGVWEFRAGGEVAGRYHCGSHAPRPYLWPINAPGDIELTRPWPMVAEKPEGGSSDHPHQRSAWFAHGDIIVAGYTPKTKHKGVDGTDFWTEVPVQGRVVCVAAKPDGETALASRNEWRGTDDTVLMTEERRLELRDFGTHRLWTWTFELKPAGRAVTFGDTKEGVFGVRISDSIRIGAEKGKPKNEKGIIANAEGGQGEKECWGVQSLWCDYSGVIGGKRVGLAMIADAANKQPSCWHAREYGLMAANPFGRAKSGFPGVKGRTDLVTLQADETLRLRYALLAHPGNAVEGRVAEFAGKAFGPK